MATLLTLDESGVPLVDSSTDPLGDANDSDFNIFGLGGTGFPPQFDSALAAAGVSLATNAALSGYSAATPQGTNVYTFGSNVTQVGFTLSGGDGVYSGLMTTSGKKLFLYVSPVDNNVLLAREGTLAAVNGDNGTPANPYDDNYVADSSGTVAFAVYLDTRLSALDTDTSDTGATGAKVWLVQYASLYQPDTTNPDDAVSPLDVIDITVNQFTNFSLEGAPSGQNLFLMFGDGTPAVDEVAIVVTGKHPADQSTGASITTGDTVNTGQGGGGTTIGSNNQMIDPNEGMYFTFVNLNADSLPNTVPNADQNVVDVEANIKFGSYYGATEASFAVVQLQPPKGATLKISAFNNTDAAEKGATYIEGLGDADDLRVNIDYVKISVPTKVGKVVTFVTYLVDANGTVTVGGVPATLPTGLSVVFTDTDPGAPVVNTVTITGAVAGDNIDYHTSSLHNRVLIDNVGNSDAKNNAAFDIGKFAVESSTSTPIDFNILAFEDDAPTAAAALDAGAVAHDETAGNQADANDTSDAAVAALFAGVLNASTDMTAGYAQGSASVIDPSGSSFGADGAAVTGATVYSLAIAPGATVDSGLDTTEGDSILLTKEGDLVVGRISGGANDGKAAFAVAINASTGVLSMVQYHSIKHPTGGPSSPDESLSIANGKLFAVATLTDGDGDQSSAQVDIGARVSMQDDGPTAGIALGGNEVTVDESSGAQDDDVVSTTTFDKEGDGTTTTLAALFAIAGAGTDLTLPQYALSAGAVVATTGSAGGADGIKSTVISLDIVGGNGTDSGLDTTDGKDIKLFKEGDLIVGRYDVVNGTVDGTDPAAFAIAIDQTGRLATVQYVSLKHPTPGNGTTPAGSFDERIDLTGLISGVVTVTDNDDDTATTSTAIGDKINFDDDGPTLAFGNVVGTGTLDPQFGYWAMTSGADGLGASELDIALTGAHLVKPDSTVIDLAAGKFTLSETAPSPDGSGAYHFTGSVTGDLDNNAATPETIEHFTLTAYANGTYAIDLVEGFQSTIVTSTAGGTLSPGGPDPVQTLTLLGGVEQVVFFAVDPTAATSGIGSAIILGATDYAELPLQQKSSMADYDQISGNGNQPGDGTYPFLNDTYAVNVSTSGIGVNNNVLQGNNTAGIQADDESFVINPQTLLTAVKVFIDNSVGGYSMASEDLYYRTYYSDGSVGALTEVNSVTSEAGGQVSFTVEREGTKMIDAVQLLMGRGDIKIPVIQFITQTNAMADSIRLDFTATVTDGDGDTASSAFNADLAANVLGGTFDYLLSGAAAKADAFNVALAPVENKYQVSGFEVGTDKLVLLGANSYVIDNSGADSIVDITETAGGQHTFVTLVGVDLAAGDIATFV